MRYRDDMTTYQEDPAKARFRKDMEKQSRRRFKEILGELEELRRIAQAGEEAFVREDTKTVDETWTIYQEMKAKQAADWDRRRQRNLAARERS